MKYLYIITIIFLLFSCGKQEEQSNPIDTIVNDEQTNSGTNESEVLNTMVGKETTKGGGYGVPEIENGKR